MVKQLNAPVNAVVLKQRDVLEVLFTIHADASDTVELRVEETKDILVANGPHDRPSGQRCNLLQHESTSVYGAADEANRAGFSVLV